MAKKLLVLYTEYAAYLDACLQKLIHLHQYEIHIVKYPLDKNAPFKIPESNAGLFFYERNQLNEQQIRQLFVTVDPDCVLVSGWVDKSYNKLSKEFKLKGKLVIILVDNLWVGSLKQVLFTFLGKFFLSSRYNKYWIPGVRQYEYLRRIGIEQGTIMLGYYSADTDLFASKYVKLQKVPKRFIYVGRLMDIKGTPTLMKAIENLCLSGHNEWEFLIIGNGLYENQIKALSQRFRNVIYKPFMQPEELVKETSGGGVFVLPSNYDAWGVVVHEYAIMGFPLILSSMVGSGNYFVTPGYNGFIFKSGNSTDLVKAMKKMMLLDERTINEMSNRSNLIGKTISTDAWAEQLNESIKSHYLN